MGGRWTTRGVNGVVSAVLSVFFLAHGALGAISILTGFASPFAWLVWCGVALVGVHVAASVVTSVQQVVDRERPPSSRKKRHLALKWATGALLAGAAAAHIALPGTSFAAMPMLAVLSVALAVHVCVGSKSLLKDLGIDRRHKMAFRIAVCVFAGAYATAAIAVMVLF